MEQEPISPEEWAEWKRNPVTQKFFHQIQEISLRVAGNLLAGSCFRDSPEQTGQAYANLVGYLSGMKMCFDYEPEELSE